MGKLREAFLQNNWQGPKSENERLLIAQRLEDYNTKILGRPPVPIHIGGVPGGAGAVCTTDKNHVEHIGISKEMLDGLTEIIMPNIQKIIWVRTIQKNRYHNES